MRKISLLLTLCLLTLTLSACASSPTDWGAISLGRRDVATDTPIEGETVAAAVSVTAPLGGMEISFDVTGEDAEITVSIYKAEKDYNTTCSQKPLREETFSHLTENLLWQFKTLPAGDYLIVFTDANNAALFLVLGIFFGFLLPFFVFASRKQDEPLPAPQYTAPVFPQQ